MLNREKKSLVVMMSSFTDDIPLPYNSIYGASKAFMWSLARSLQPELAPKVDVSALRPLYVKTRLAAFMSKQDWSVIPTDDFVTSCIKDIEKGKFMSYGHWKHKLIGKANSISELARRRVDKYFLDCNMEADAWVEKHKKQAKK